MLCKPERWKSADDHSVEFHAIIMNSADVHEHFSSALAYKACCIRFRMQHATHWCVLPCSALLSQSCMSIVLAYTGLMGQMAECPLLDTLLTSIRSWHSPTRQTCTWQQTYVLFHTNTLGLGLCRLCFNQTAHIAVGDPSHQLRCFAWALKSTKLSTQPVYAKGKVSKAECVVQASTKR